ncbi:MAG TPA: hypothetical protein VK176_11580 [Phycisphaerales bacterium]|nr:hypothetical protein [Phycisphaerales bacterium]
MKLKGISKVEQHFEKAVVGGVGVVLLGVLGMQFLYEPNLVKVGDGQPVPPGNAYRPVESAAQALMGKLDRAAGQALVPEEPRISLLQAYQEKVRGGVSRIDRLAALGPSMNLGDAVATSGPRSGSPVTVAAIPAPSSPVVHAYAAALDPFEVVASKELRAMFPATEGQPFDKQWVSVEAIVDGTAIKSALESDPDGEAGPARAIPRGWYEGQIEVVGVQLERRKLSGDAISAAVNGELAATTESWSEPAMVQPMPGTKDVVGSMLKDVKSMTDLASELSRVRGETDSILRPPFISTIAGPQWLPPSEAKEAQALLEGKNPLDVLNEQIAEKERRLAAVEKRLSGGGTPPRRSDNMAPEGGGKGGGGSERGGGGARPPRQGQTGPDRQTRALEVQRDKFQKELAELRQKLEEAQSGANSTSTKRVENKPLLTDSNVKVWAHDVWAEPGAVYEYRTRIVINNPMFGRTGLADEASSKSPVLYGDWSDWTNPVLVMPTEVYFVSSGSPRSASRNLASATAECYVFYYGYYRKGSAVLEPGDSIRTVAKTPPNLMTYDEAKILEGARPPQITQAPGPGERRITRDGEDTMAPERTGGKPGGSHGEGGHGEFTEQTTPGAPPVTDEALKAMLLPAKKEIPISISDVFLDVGDVPILGLPKVGETSDISTLFRTAEGELTTRLPAVERGSPLYKIIAASAAQGATQGQPKPEPKKSTPIQREERSRRVFDEGGGGGGGG